MANYEKASSHSVHGNHDVAATANTSAITVRGSRLIDLSLDFGTGSGAGTVILQRETLTTADADTFLWQDVESYTGDTEKVIRSGATRRYRLAITTSSGEIAFELTAGNKE